MALLSSSVAKSYRLGLNNKPQLASQKPSSSTPPNHHFHTSSHPTSSASNHAEPITLEPSEAHTAPHLQPQQQLQQLKHITRDLTNSKISIPSACTRTLKISPAISPCGSLSKISAHHPSPRSPLMATSRSPLTRSHVSSLIHPATQIASPSACIQAHDLSPEISHAQ